MPRFEAMLGGASSQRLHDGREDEPLQYLHCQAEQCDEAVGAALLTWLPCLQDRDYDWSSSGACWKRALTPWPDVFTGARWHRRPSGPRCPTRCLWLPPPIDPAEQLLPRSYQSPPALTAAPLTTLWPISLAVPLISRPCPGGICERHPSRSLNSWHGFVSLAICPTADRFWLLSFITFIPAAGLLLPGLQRDHIIISPFTPLHLTRGPGVVSPLC